MQSVSPSRKLCAFAALLFTAALALRAGECALADCPPYWSPVGGGVGTDEPDSVRDLAVFEGRLIVAGSFRAAGGQALNNIAAWDGRTWSPLGNGISADYPGLSALAVWDDGNGGGPALFAARTSQSGSPKPIDVVYRWNGASWTVVGTMTTDAQLRTVNVYEMFAFDDGDGAALYVGGYFGSVGGVANTRALARWNGRQWSAVGGGLATTSLAFHYTIVGGLAAFDDGGGPALYVGGYFNRAGRVTVNNLARWNGQTWAPVSSGIPWQRGIPPVQTLILHADGGPPALLIGGLFASPANNVVKWTGTAYVDLAGGVTGNAPRVFDLLSDTRTPDSPALYATGLFSRAGSVNASHIAVWQNGSWAALGAGLQPSPNSDEPGTALALYDEGYDPMLFVSGDFIGAGGRPARNLARWGCSRGDLNCDGRLDNFDIDPFVLALTDAGAYQGAYPYCNVRIGDFNDDGAVNNFDVDPFVAALARL